MERLLSAYRSGIFPWFNEGHPLLWWSPNPRGILPLGDVHVSRSMRRVIRQGRFQLTWNRMFLPVMQHCGAREEGTWIVPEMLFAYERLHRLGCAHSLEVWNEGALVGGLYGVQVGGVFAAESMFHRQPNASKVALIAAAQSLAAAGIELFDVQFRTDHLQTLGVREIPRTAYLDRLESACDKQVDLHGMRPTISP